MARPPYLPPKPVYLRCECPWCEAPIDVLKSGDAVWDSKCPCCQEAVTFGVSGDEVTVTMAPGAEVEQ